MMSQDCRFAFEYFKKQLEKKFLCDQCKDLLITCHQTSCGCLRVCENCRWVETCKVCDKAVTFNKDRGHVRDLKNIKVKCMYNDCKKEFSYEHYSKHVINCSYRDIQCKDCDKTVLQKDFDQHKSEMCDRIRRKCDICKDFVNFSKTKHLHFSDTSPPECRQLYGDCPNCLKKNVKLRTHYDCCQSRPCLLKEYGCSGRVEQDKCSENDNHGKILDKVTEEFNNDLKKILEKKPQGTVEIMNNSKDEIKKLEKEISRLKIMMDSDEKLYRTYQKERLVWRITNVDEFLTEKYSRLSNPIYSHQWGYKLCIKAYPQGDGIGRFNYLSLYYVILKGEYDNLLQWPFNKKIKLTLFNQVDKSRSKSEIYKPDFKSPSIEKPKNDMNIATGNPKFISLVDLQDFGFIKENVMFIELSFPND